jgi:C4-dicarboxylate-specific signal transduction histidine kinase
MIRILLYAYSDNEYLIPILYGVGALLFIILCYGIYRQRSVGAKIRKELAELEKVRQNNIEYEFLLKAMKIAVWHIDPKMRTLTVDADFREMKGSASAAVNTPLEIIEQAYDKNDRKRVRRTIDALCDGRIDSCYEQYRIAQDNALYWEECYATISARDDEGNPTAIVGTSMCIDERKKMEADLISARNKAEESDRLKTAFLANMGHEIRTPLNAIVGFADLLPVVQTDEDRNQLISEIQTNNRKLLQIIDGLVSMSKIEAEAKSLVMSQTDIVPVLQAIADTHAQLVDGMTVVIDTHFSYPELLMYTDIAKLTETVDHLMQNAVKFTTQGSITLGFDLVKGDHVRIFVRDTGKGIAKEDQERIFERFVKIDEYIPGTGVGLSVAKAHVESMHGTIGVESSLGEGSTFWIELPLS